MKNLLSTVDRRLRNPQQFLDRQLSIRRMYYIRFVLLVCTLSALDVVPVGPTGGYKHLPVTAYHIMRHVNCVFTYPGLLTILVKSIAIFITNTRPKKYCQYQYQ